MNDKLNNIKERIDAHIEELMPIYLVSYRVYDDDEASMPEKYKALEDMLKSNEIFNECNDAYPKRPILIKGGISH